MMFSGVGTYFIIENLWISSTFYYPRNIKVLIYDSTLMTKGVLWPLQNVGQYNISQTANLQMYIVVPFKFYIVRTLFPTFKEL